MGSVEDVAQGITHMRQVTTTRKLQPLLLPTPIPATLRERIPPSGIMPLMSALCNETERDVLPFQKPANATFAQEQYLLFPPAASQGERHESPGFASDTNRGQGNEAPT